MTSEQSLLAANAAFYQAFVKKDLEAMEAVWSQGTGSICVHPGRNALKGWEDIRSSWARIFRSADYFEIDLEVVSSEVNGNIAYVVVVENVLQVGSGGRRVKALSVATNVFELMAQKWYLIHHHGSPIMG